LAHDVCKLCSHSSDSDLFKPACLDENPHTMTNAPHSELSEAPPRASLLGTTALLFEPPGEMDIHTQRRIWWLARQVETWPDIKETVPGMSNLMLVFATPPRDPDSLIANLIETWNHAEELHLEGGLSSCPSSMAASKARTSRTLSRTPV
jgi:hypothetical protein